MTRSLPLWVLTAATAACAADGQGDFGRLENRTDATVVLVGPEAWTYGDDRWAIDCDAESLTVDVVGDALGRHPEARADAREEIGRAHV